MKCKYCKKEIYGKCYLDGQEVIAEFIMHDLDGRQLQIRKHTCNFKGEVYGN
jgi:hypothetical protein